MLGALCICECCCNWAKTGLQGISALGNHYNRLRAFAGQEVTKLQAWAGSVLPATSIYSCLCPGARFPAPPGARCGFSREFSAWFVLQVLRLTGPLCFCRCLTTKIITGQMHFLITKNMPLPMCVVCV